MRVCASCGQENPDIARFCFACAAPLEEEAAPREVRKIVTVVFSDLAGSTSMGERLDPESVRRVMARYFEEMRLVLERHGGTVEKFIGDAIMAAFGIPELHEDDALRAVRAAVEMREAQSRLNGELEATYGVRLAVRTGVNTGEVVAGDPSRGQAFATGDAVNVAARLEQAAAPGEILVGNPTYRLVRDAVTAEAVAPLALKGKAEPVPAWRLVDVASLAPGVARRLDSPLVGREHEVSVIEQAFARARSDRSCQLVTVLGSAGAGKSRLAAEVVDRLANDGRVLEGRCLPYGEGITFWPLAEIVKAAADIAEADSPAEAKEKIERLLPDEEDGPQIADRVAGALGLRETAGSLQETFWAVRRLLEALARRRPLVVLFEDIHWAEPGLLDLIEYLAGWSTDAPMLVLCLARQELLEVRPSIATPKPNATSILLQSLGQVESAELTRNLLGRAGLAGDIELRIIAAAEGNPLFLEELLHMLIDDGLLRRANGQWLPTADLSSISIPPTIQALLAARLDRLERGEQGVIQRASVVGREFWWGAVAELSPVRERTAVGAHLQTLVRKELIRPDASSFSGEDAFRFGHILIRDAAYGAMAKDFRADLHERFVDWLQARAGERVVEYDEILGYHLEQALRYRAELAPADDRARAVGSRAGGHLGAAGQRAFVRGDVAAAANLLGRAVEVTPPEDSRRIELMLDYAEALRTTGEFVAAGEVLGSAVDAAEAAADHRLRAHATIQELLLRTDTDPDLPIDEVLRISEAAFPVFAEFADDLGFTRAWRAIAEVHLTTCRWGSSAEALERALEHAKRAGDQKEAAGIFNHLANALFWGPTPVGEGKSRCEDILAQAREHERRIVEANTVCYLAGFEAMEGSFEEARALYRRGGTIFLDLGHRFGLAAHTLLSGQVEMLAGDFDAAEREFRSGYDILESMGETGVLSSSAAFLAEALFAQGRHEEAQKLTVVSEETASADDAAAQIGWRITRAKVAAEHGDSEQAERLAHEAVELAERTDFLNMRGDAYVGYACALGRASRAAAAADAFRRAIGLYEQKGNAVSARTARGLLAG